MAAAKAKKAGKAKKAAKVVVKVKKTASSLSTRKKAAPARSTKKAAAAPARLSPISVGKEPFNKAALIRVLVERTGLGRKEVVNILDTLKDVMIAHLVKKGPGKFKLPGVLNIKIKDKPATKARKGINPFTGEEMMFSAKPARRTVKISALKKLKEQI